jgi:hypothetical protein
MQHIVGVGEVNYDNLVLFVDLFPYTDEVAVGRIPKLDDSCRRSQKVAGLDMF